MGQESIGTPPSVEERHEKGFNGIYIPWHVFELIELKKLKAIDVLILCTIHSLCHKGRGCFASNAYLGKCVGVSEKRASEIISKLRQLNLVMTTAYDGRRRTLQVIYNMNPAELQRETPEKRGVRLRKTPEKRGVRLRKTPEKRGVWFPKNGESGSRKTGTEIIRGESSERDQDHKSMSEGKPSDRTSETSSLSDEGKQAVSPSSESNGSHRRRKKKRQPSAWDERAAHKFAEVVKTYRKVQKNSDLRQWANVFRQMREVDGTSKKDIGETIVWYRKHIGEDYVPEAFSAATFRKKFNEGKFKSAMRRSQNGSASNGRRRLTRENMWNDPDNILPCGILKIEIGRDGREYDGLLLHKIRRRVSERFGRGRPLPEELKMLLEEEFPGVKDVTPSIIGAVQ